MNESIIRFLDIDFPNNVQIRWLDEYANDDLRPALGLVLNYSSWNRAVAEVTEVYRYDFVQTLAKRVLEGLACQKFVFCRQIDRCDETMDQYICDNHYFQSGRDKRMIPPESLPVFSLILVRNDSPLISEYNTNISPKSIYESLAAFSEPTNESDPQPKQLLTTNDLCSLMASHVNQFAQEYNVGVDLSDSSDTLRIFVAGDRSSVGKSSVCLGIIGNLLKQGYKPEDLAYIKPATQSESTQLVQLYCNKRGIACVPIGPLVYYRGFTRAFLAGETQSTEELLEMCERSVDRIAVGKRVVLVDGVGFPAVGSICGTDNASVLKACSYPVRDENDEVISRKPMAVLLVGGGGVGGAVDAFNLNSTYFAAAGVKVIGAIFNKLALGGFYSLENCKDQVTRYFDSNEEQIRQGRRPFGFVPQFPQIALPDAIDHVDEFIELFGSHVDIPSLLESAKQVKDEDQAPDLTRPLTMRKIELQRTQRSRNRADIELSAISAGAAPSA